MHKDIQSSQSPQVPLAFVHRPILSSAQQALSISIPISLSEPAQGRLPTAALAVVSPPSTFAMASPAVVVPNGIPATVMHAANGAVHPASDAGDDAPSSSPTGSQPAKRKRDDDSMSVVDDRPASVNGLAVGLPVSTKVDRLSVESYLVVLQKHDIAPSILSRPISATTDSNEPQTKRHKSQDPSITITDKVARGEYEDAETILADIKKCIQDRLAELNAQKTESWEANSEKERAVASTIAFAQHVCELFSRELNYPTPRPAPKVLESLTEFSALQPTANGDTMLTVYGDAPRHRPLYSSIQQPTNSSDSDQLALVLREKGLPAGVKTAQAMPYTFSMPADKNRKAKTLGELFPPPRNLQSLQPPKAPKSSTKGVHVGWHRPELTEKSKYRVGSYFSQNISTGRWLDYSNAAPPQQIMTKQRERALSLAGNKPSITELEASEMESLFRGAFSSFAPSKDDSAAMVSSGLISQTIWWQKHGKRSFDRLIEADQDPEEEVSGPATNASDMVVDEAIIESAIENWDDSLLDPSLEQACFPGSKTQEEKDADDLLQEVSDMIQTLVSYQKNRNLALPSPAVQSRYAADPAHSDMLTNGNPAQPDEEETATYDVLRAQLSLIVQSLPPYAVARLNSDKLDELNISMKLEVKTDEYRGSMDEDEAAVRARIASQAGTQPVRPPSHRASSSYGQQQYQNSRTPIANAQYYGGAQTPVRPAPMQRPAQSIPPNFNQRPPGLRQPNQYTKAAYDAAKAAHAVQLQAQAAAQAQAQGQSAAYGTPTQNRHVGYSTMGTPNTQPRFSAYQPNAQTPNMTQGHHNYQQQGTPTHPQYNQYPQNGVPPPRAAPSPHAQHMPPQHGYRPTGTPQQQRQPSFSAQQQQQPAAGHPQTRGGYPQQAPMMPQQMPLHQGMPGKAGSPVQYHGGIPPMRGSISGHAAVPDMGAGTLSSVANGVAPTTNGVQASANTAGKGV